MFRAFRFDLHPTPAQAELLAQTAGVCRLVYNLAWEQRRDFWRQYRRTVGRSISFPSQCAELTPLRAEFDWIAAVNRVAQEQALRDLDAAWSAFFSGSAAYPKPRRKGEDDRFRCIGKDCAIRRLNAKWGEIKLPKIGWVRLRMTRDTRGDLRSVTVSLNGDAWTAALAYRIDHEAPATSAPAVGIDRGVANTLSLSTGEMLRLPESLRAVEASVKRAQRALARRKRGSKRYAAQRKLVASKRSKVARVRRDFHHKAALHIARRFGTAVLEDLRVKSMTASAAGTIDMPGRGVAQKSGLNRSILNQGWHAFERILNYKTEERGGSVVKVPAAYTSQTCAACGVVDARSRESQAIFRCVHCGHADHADTNAALEILRRHTASMDVKGAHFAPAEASTFGPLAA